MQGSKLQLFWSHMLLNILLCDLDFSFGSTSVLVLIVHVDYRNTANQTTVYVLLLVATLKM